VRRGLAIGGLLAAGAGWAVAGSAAVSAAASAAGDASRGAALVASRSQGLCSLCHAVPGQPPHLQGDIGPPLHGVGARLDADALRQRLLAPQRFNPDTVMPAYGPPAGAADGRDDARQRVPAALRGKPLLTAAQLDDVVAYLASLK